MIQHGGRIVYARDMYADYGSPTFMNNRWFVICIPLAMSRVSSWYGGTSPRVDGAGHDRTYGVKIFNEQYSTIFRVFFFYLNKGESYWPVTAKKLKSSGSG